VPLEDLVNKFSHMRFEPMGHTTNPEIRIAKSMVDYIFRWMGIRFLPGYHEAHANLNQPPQVPTPEDDDSQHRPAAMKAGGLITGKAATSENGTSTQARSASEGPGGKTTGSKPDTLARSASEGKGGGYSLTSNFSALFADGPRLL
jgi:ribonucleoside-diphosphate reductase alpha chain